MKKQILLVVLFINAIAAQGQGVRNSLLGIYSGQYYLYSEWPSHNDAGVKLTALPGDTAGMIFEDTINNVSDTISFFFTYDINWNINDTVLFNYSQDCGFLLQQYDSLFYGRYVPNDAPSGVSEHRLKCVEHSFPTVINEIEKPAFSLYPNPTTDKLFVSTEKNIFKTYSIYTVYGQVVDSGIYSTTIEVRSLPVGMYYLKLKGKYEAVKSFIKN